jgi:hypothetical protein
MALRSSIHLQLFQECIGTFIDYKLKQSFDTVLFSRNDFNIEQWIDEFIDNNFLEELTEDDYKNFIGDDYLRSSEVYMYMINYIHIYRDDYLGTTEILYNYDYTYVLQYFIYCYCRIKHYDILISIVTEWVNNIHIISLD